MWSNTSGSSSLSGSFNSFGLFKSTFCSRSVGEKNNNGDDKKQKLNESKVGSEEPDDVEQHQRESRQLGVRTSALPSLLLPPGAWSGWCSVTCCCVSLHSLASAPLSARLLLLFSSYFYRVMEIEVAQHSAGDLIWSGPVLDLSSPLLLSSGPHLRPWSQPEGSRERPSSLKKAPLSHKRANVYIQRRPKISCGEIQKFLGFTVCIII